MKKLLIFLLVVSSLVMVVGKLIMKKQSVDVLRTDWTRGNAGASVLLVEYGDFQCPSCGAYYPIIKQLETEYKDKLAVVFRQYPLEHVHKNALAAAKAAEAAGELGKFWEMHDVLFEKQKEWVDLDNPLPKFNEYAQGLGLSKDRFNSLMNDAKIETNIRADMATGDKANVEGTPTFFVNGKIIGLPGGLEGFKKIINGASVDTSEKVHDHFDFAMYTDLGDKMNFAKPEFMERDEAIHMHDNNGEVVHIHSKGVTLGQFLKSIGEESPAEAAWYVNGVKMNGPLDNYQPKDLDRIVVNIMGIGQTLNNAVLDKMVSDKACIYSEKCPERGKPPTEECVGGLGTDCK